MSYSITSLTEFLSLSRADLLMVTASKRSTLFLLFINTLSPIITRAILTILLGIFFFLLTSRKQFHLCCLSDVNCLWRKEMFLFPNYFLHLQTITDLLPIKTGELSLPCYFSHGCGKKRWIQQHWCEVIVSVRIWIWFGYSIWHTVSPLHIPIYYT